MLFVCFCQKRFLKPNVTEKKNYWQHFCKHVNISICSLGFCSGGSFFGYRAFYVAQASLELSIFLPQPPECWDIMCFWEFTVPMDGSRPSMNDSSFLQLCTKQHLIFFTIRKSYFLFSRSGVWTQGLHLELLHKPHFLWRIFFEIGSRELFAWAGLKP
jgi:hypothetical protein